MAVRNSFIDLYIDLGWVIMPLDRAGSRGPSIDDWPDLEHPVSNYAQYRNRGIYLQCGQRSGVTLIDIDDMALLPKFLPLIEQHPTPYARTPRGVHFYIRHSAKLQNAALGKIDIRNDGGGAVLPHGTEERAWVPGYEPWQIELADPEPYEAFLVASDGTKDPEGVVPTDGSAESASLTQLIREQPEHGNGNNHLAKIAGHFAEWVPYEDVSLELLFLINNSWDDPMPRGRIIDTVGKMWQRHKTRNPIPTGPGQELPIQHDEGDLYFWRGQGSSKERYLWMSPAPDIVQERTKPDGDLVWELRNDKRKVLISTADLHHSGRLSSRLGRIKTVLYPNAVGGQPHGAIFTQWLLESECVSIEETPYWGWCDNEWVGLEGERQGPSDYKLRIGHVDRPDIIEQMPTWQTPPVAAVFCSWVALQAVKGKVTLPIEPNVVLQGQAGSGKTRGLFSFGSRLTGSPRQAISTWPVLRDRVARHKNGITVVDDQSDFDSAAKVLEVYRLSAMNQAMSKKSQDSPGAGYTNEETADLLGSILVSGEGLNRLVSDKAARDRSVVLEIPPAAGRMSLIDSKRAQWDDMQAVFKELGGTDEETAHELAGPFIRRMLAAVDEVELPDWEADRVDAKLQAIQYGADLWHQAYPESRTDDGQTLPQVVNTWCQLEPDSNDWSTFSLIASILPELVDPAVSVNLGVRLVEGRLAVHVPRTSEAYLDRHRYDARAKDIGSQDNIRRELASLKALGLALSPIPIDMGGRKARAWRLVESVTDYIYNVVDLEKQRSGGGSQDGSDLSERSLPYEE